MNVNPGIYKNILDLYKRSKDFREAFNEDKANTHRSGQNNNWLTSYMDDYADRPNIVDGVLQDVLHTGEYKFKLSRHHHWRDIKITISRRKK